MHITKYLNELEEKNDSKQVQVLIEQLRAIKSLCDAFYFNPTRLLAEHIISEICDWDIKEEL